MAETLAMYLHPTALPPHHPLSTLLSRFFIIYLTVFSNLVYGNNSFIHTSTPNFVPPKLSPVGITERYPLSAGCLHCSHKAHRTKENCTFSLRANSASDRSLSLRHASICSFTVAQPFDHLWHFGPYSQIEKAYRASVHNVFQSYLNYNVYANPHKLLSCLQAFLL